MRGRDVQEAPNKSEWGSRKHSQAGCSLTKGKRSQTGSPRLKWLIDVEQDLEELEVRRW